MRLNTVKTFSVWWSRRWVRQGENSKISESCSFRKQITHHIFSLYQYIYVPGIHTQSCLHKDAYQKTVFFYSPSWEAALPDALKPIETSSTSLSVTSPQLTLKNSLQLSFPSLLICKMELLIPLSLTKCIWEALIRHEIGRKVVRHHTPIFIAQKDALWKWELANFLDHLSWVCFLPEET